MLTELARAPSGFTFGQLIRRNTEAAKVDIRKFLSKTARADKAVIAQVAEGVHQPSMKMMSIKVYGTLTQVLLDSGAVPNLMSASLAVTLSLSPEHTPKNIMVTDCSNAITLLESIIRLECV